MKFFSGSFGSLLIASFSLALIISGCNSQKETVASRGMQNLTAKYNILYNSGVLLDESREKIEAGYFDNFSETLSIYKEPNEKSSQAEAGNLDSIIAKANVIVSEKNQSEYVDDAYFVIAKANYLKANFFNAIEFFNYIYRTYPKENEIRQASLAWKIRAQMQLGLLTEAKETIDTALKIINPKLKSAAPVYAASAAYYIKTAKHESAIDLLQKALKLQQEKQSRIRQKFVLAQLQEKIGKLQPAYENYSSVAKSNAAFEMAFNANLSRIQIEENAGDKPRNKVERLKNLLSNDKYKEFLDQIYFRIGSLYAAEGNLQEAIENYNKSIRASTSNQSQKGLAYLQLAEINFRNADYAGAKKYYDSTLTSLPPSYSEYEQIKKKSTNLDLLADRLKTIATETTLQELARLNEPEREKRIGELVREQAQKALGSPSNQTPAAKNAKLAVTEGAFYFNNTAAISQGLADFQKRWGKRRLEDNWRRSSKTAAEVSATNLLNPDDHTAGATVNPATGNVNVSGNSFKNIPLTPIQLEQSNKRIADSYYDIANFYKDELKDYDEAVKTFEELLRRYPENKYKAAVYYNLYRLNAEKNMAKSEEYKNLILSKYAETAFAKVIKDPNFSLAVGEQEKELNNAYNEVYNLYIDKNYSSILDKIKEIEKKFAPNNFSGQLAYLNALAVGRTQNLTAFESALNTTLQNYQSDSLIAPLVKQHLAYITVNRTKLAARPIAIIDNDPTEEKYVEEPQQQIAQVPTPTAGQNQITKEEKPAEVSKLPENQETAIDPGNPDAQTAAEPTSPANSFFTLPDSAEYYFVVNISDPGVNLSSSRFGLGQFNRTHYGGSAIKHQLKNINNQNQIIYIGPFNRKDAVLNYEGRISPLLKNIMKVSSDKYNTFAITKEGLERLNSEMMLSAYLDFYKSNK